MAWIHFFHHDDSPSTCEFPITPIKPSSACCAVLLAMQIREYLIGSVIPKVLSVAAKGLEMVSEASRSTSKVKKRSGRVRVGLH
jgi:hypothetical protein